MRKEEIRSKGLVLAVPDEFLKSCKVGNVLFRVWFQVGKKDLHVHCRYDTIGHFRSERSGSRNLVNDAICKMQERFRYK